jgi:hypothetical protein
MRGFFRGSWPDELALGIRLLGDAGCVIAIAIAEANDRWRGLRRDWLHAAGIGMALGLAAVDLSLQGYFVWLRWR